MAAETGWVIVVAAAVGGTFGVLGGVLTVWIQGLREDRRRREELLRGACVRLLTLPVTAIYAVGWYSTKETRRFVRWRPGFVEVLRKDLGEILAEMVRAKSELDLLVWDERILKSADDLLEATAAFVSEATAPARPSQAQLDRDTRRVSEARLAFAALVQTKLKLAVK